MKTELRTKRIVRVSGEVQLPIKVGEELSYISGNIMYWTDRVKKILEIADEIVVIAGGKVAHHGPREAIFPLLLGEYRQTFCPKQEQEAER